MDIALARGSIQHPASFPTPELPHAARNHEKYLDCSESKNMPSRSIGIMQYVGTFFNMDGLIEGVQSRGTALLNDIKPFSWVSKELSLIKEFLLM